MRQVTYETMLPLSGSALTSHFTVLSITKSSYIITRLGRARPAKGRELLYTKGAVGPCQPVPAGVGRECMGSGPEGWVECEFTNIEICDTQLSRLARIPGDGANM